MVRTSDPTDLDTSARQFGAFANPTRLRIVNLLAAQELCVCHLVDVLGEPQPKISRHLAMLRRAGLVTRRVDGAWRHYGLPARTRGLAGRMIAYVRSSLAEIPELKADRERLAATDLDLGCS